MAATVLHFGADICQRLPLLNSVGYSVKVCPTLPEFRSLIRQKADAEAVLVASERSRERREVISLTRENTHARLILFASYSGAYQSEFDLVIEPLTPPEEWLRRVVAFIELNARSKSIRERSEQLLKECESVRQQSILERERAAWERAKTEILINSIKRKPDHADES